MGAVKAHVWALESDRSRVKFCPHHSSCVIPGTLFSVSNPSVLIYRDRENNSACVTGYQYYEVK